jgi:hypothetical protein
MEETAQQDGRVDDFQVESDKVAGDAPQLRKSQQRRHVTREREDRKEGVCVDCKGKISAFEGTLSYSRFQLW